ncbi:hypothetical protein [Kitasatospora terrestris]|uniref:DeoR-like transcriptional repressor C-terminal sensor domain-containing protein n=1 Tax=Kitasatospora terrestris TaxID=258051 RepID=A0ABP9DC65_9ACTN
MPGKDRGPDVELAVAAAGLVLPGSVVALPAGRSACGVARHLLGIPRLTVVTNSLPAAGVLRYEGGGPETAAPAVLLTGGTTTRSGTVLGPLAEQAIHSLHADVVILGAHGISADGITAAGPAEARAERAFLASARRAVALADTAAWATAGSDAVATLDEVDVLVVHGALPARTRSRVARAVRDLLVAGAG